MHIVCYVVGFSPVICGPPFCTRLCVKDRKPQLCSKLKDW